MIELIIDLKLLRDDWEYGVEIFQNDQNIAAETVWPIYFILGEKRDVISG